MGISINSNIAALRQSLSGRNHANLQKSLDRLSSGRRITAQQMMPGALRSR